MDSTVDYKLPFTYTGNAVEKTRLDIYSADTDSIVAVSIDTINSSLNYHIIKANTLQNGNKYYAKMYVTYKINSGETREDLTPSNIINFSCNETASISFINIPTTITNSSYGFVVEYKQPQKDALYEYRLEIKDSNNHTIYQSDVLYNDDLTVPLQKQIDVYNLVDGTYTIQCVGMSLSGLRFESKWEQVVVKYSKPTNYSLLLAENKPDLKSIELSTNLKIIEGYIKSGNEPTFISSEYVYLTNETLVFDGLGLTDDFTMYLVGNSLPLYNNIVQLSDTNSTITISTCYEKLYGETKNKFYLKLSVDDKRLKYRNGNGSVQSASYSKISNLIEPKITSKTVTDNIVIYLCYANGLFSIKTEIQK